MPGNLDRVNTSPINVTAVPPVGPSEANGPKLKGTSSKSSSPSGDTYVPQTLGGHLSELCANAENDLKRLTRQCKKARIFSGIADGALAVGFMGTVAAVAMGFGGMWLLPIAVLVIVGGLVGATELHRKHNKLSEDILRTEGGLLFGNKLDSARRTTRIAHGLTPPAAASSPPLA